MDKVQGTSAKETARIFKEMGLETNEQRSKMLAQDSVPKPALQVRYVIRLSNGSQPAPFVG